MLEGFLKTTADRFRRKIGQTFLTGHALGFPGNRFFPFSGLGYGIKSFGRRFHKSVQAD